MDKQKAIEILGGTVALAAKAIGISSSAVSQWPDVLPSRIEDRVIAAAARIKAGKTRRVAVTPASCAVVQGA